MVHRSVINVLEAIDSPNILDVGVALLVDGVEAEEIAEDFIAIVPRGIVDDHYFVVGVVLREDGIQVRLYSEPGVVVKGRNQDTHGKLFLDLR